MSSLNKKDKIVGSKHIKLSLVVGNLPPFKLETGVSSDKDLSKDVSPIHAIGTEKPIDNVSGNISYAGGLSLQKGEYDDLILLIKSLDFSFNTVLDISEIEVSLISFDSWQSITTVYEGVIFSKESSSSERNTHETIVNLSFLARIVKIYFPV